MIARRQLHLPLRVHRASRASTSTAHRVSRATTTTAATRAESSHASRVTVTTVTTRSVQAEATVRVAASLVRSEKFIIKCIIPLHINQILLRHKSKLLGAKTRAKTRANSLFRQPEIIRGPWGRVWGPFPALPALHPDQVRRLIYCLRNKIFYKMLEHPAGRGMSLDSWQCPQPNPSTLDGYYPPSRLVSN